MIRAENIGKQFDTHWLFRHVSFEIKKGQKITLIGPSGSGKTTLLKMIASLIRPDEGQIVLQSQNIGMLFQKNALFDSMTVIQNLLFPLKEKKQLAGEAAEKTARDYLKSVGLDHCSDLMPHELSGGMQKRLGIARALIVEPEIILYDDPTAGLDPVTSRMIADLLLDLQRKKDSTLLTVTNDIQRALQLGDEVWFLAQGTLINGGSPKQIFETKNPSLKQFMYGQLEGPLT